MSKSLLVVGGAGALGRQVHKPGSSVLKRFKSVYNCVNVSPAASSLAHHNIAINADEVLSKSAVEKIRKQAEGVTNKFDAVICTAGGFNGSQS